MNNTIFYDMSMEKDYTKSTDQNHIKAYGQYFTNPIIAKFMCEWACENAKTLLDPAVGNSVFLKYARAEVKNCKLYGYEIDENILDFFGNPSKATIYNLDYLVNDWDKKYDSIVCNPPYNRFQSISNRTEVLEEIYKHTGVKYSSYTNQYILFLIKSIYQMAEKGRIAYIIPSEFLNSKYGIPIKQLMIDKKILSAIINIQNDKDVFFNATTTCCILLLEKNNQDTIRFYNLENINHLKGNVSEILEREKYLIINYTEIDAKEKWRNYLNHEQEKNFKNLVSVSKFCSISRGIATGANSYYCFSDENIKKYKLEKKFFSKCICRSADVKNPIFNEKAFDEISKQNKTVYLLDIKEPLSNNIKEYIKEGEKQGVNMKYLPSRRNPWYSMEQKEVAPIWVSSACREKMKFVRNLAGTKSLTTFHSVYVKDEYSRYIDIIFCYFLTPTAQLILRENRKELGNGLEKFQPNDLNSASMLDITLLDKNDQEEILKIYEQMKKKYDDYLLEELDKIFIKYL